MRVIFIATSVFLCTLLGYGQPVGYDYGKHISINASEVSGLTDFTDFTILLHVTDNQLRSVSNGGHVESENGYDILFTLGDCSTLLNHQIEKYDPITGELVFWVQIPNLSASFNTNIHMYYGNSGVGTDPSSYSTWNSNYEGVWHMNNDPSSSLLLDYSGDGINGDSHGAMTTADLVDGKIGDAIDFDGSNDYFSLTSKNFNTTGEIEQMTVSAWVNTSYSAGGNHTNWSILDFDRSEYYNLFISGNGRLCYATSRPGSTFNDSYAGAVSELNDGTWHHVAAVYNGTNKLLYIDGALAFTQVSPHGGLGIGTGITRYGFIGDGSEANSYNGSRNNIYYDGMYDEIRYTTDALSTDWISTEFNNQNSPATFYSISAEFPSGDLCTLLPVSFLKFEAAQENTHIKLNWTTLSENNNSHFTVARSNSGHSNWQTIVEVNGAKNSSIRIDYESFDNSPAIGINYYRLTQTDFDGTVVHLDSTAVVYELETPIHVFPNPAKNLITLYSKQNLDVNEIIIYDLQGRDVTYQTSLISTINHSYNIDLRNLEAGIYIIRTSFGNLKFQKL